MSLSERFGLPVNSLQGPAKKSTCTSYAGWLRNTACATPAALTRGPEGTPFARRQVPASRGRFVERLKSMEH